MSTEKKYTGFESYIATGTFTREFIHDYEYWCKRIFFQWKKLDMDFDTFYETCWEALLKKINMFDPKIATIQTFCISRINNEAWRAYMAYKAKKKRPEVDCNSELMENTLTDDTEDPKQSLQLFVSYCNRMGVTVNFEELYNDYIQYDGKKVEASAPIIAYAWWRASNNEVGGRNDISKKRRRADN